MSRAPADSRLRRGVAVACRVHVDVLDSNGRGDESGLMTSMKRRCRGPLRLERQVEIA
jgi:hypothetical protein